MKVLLLTISAGGGHNSAAQALSNYFNDHGADTKIVDTYNYLNKLLGSTVSKGLIFSISNFKDAYEKIYSLLEKRKHNAHQMSATRLYNHFFLHKMKKLIRNYDPDVIVCTHIYAGIIVDILKQKQQIRAKTLGIVTDYVFHPYWEECLHFDYVVMPSELLSFQAKQKGYTKAQVLPLGIPIHPRFAEELDRAACCRELGLHPDMKTVMIMSGSMGFGDMVTEVDEIDKVDYPFQMVCVCGSNTDAKKRIDKKLSQYNHKVINFGYTDKVDRIMNAADCLVSKPGGLTVSEAMAKRLPLIINTRVPGHENRNAVFLLNCGVAMATSDTTSIEELIYQLFANPTRLDSMRAATESIRKPHSTADICEFILQQCSKEQAD